RRQPGVPARTARRPGPDHRARSRDVTVRRARAAWLLVTCLAVSCGGRDRTHSPTCGMAQLIGPSLIQDQLRLLPFVLTEPPRGLPGSLPARVAGNAQQSTVAISYSGQRLAMAYQGPNFPPYPSDSTVYALLVVTIRPSARRDCCCTRDNGHRSRIR